MGQLRQRLINHHWRDEIENIPVFVFGSVFQDIVHIIRQDTSDNIIMLSVQWADKAYLKRALHKAVARNTSYLSAASASNARTGNARDSKSGGICGYMNWNRRSSVVESSGISTFSPWVSKPGGANPPACVSIFFRCTWKRTPSMDWKVTSASAAQTISIISSLISLIRTWGRFKEKLLTSLRYAAYLFNLFSHTKEHNVTRRQA